MAINDGVKLVKVCYGPKLVASRPPVGIGSAAWRVFVGKYHPDCIEAVWVGSDTISICDEPVQPKHCPLSQAEYDALPVVSLTEALAKVVKQETQHGN
jgi:hypothetical protein